MHNVTLEPSFCRISLQPNKGVIGAQVPERARHSPSHCEAFLHSLPASRVRRTQVCPAPLPTLAHCPPFFRQAASSGEAGGGSGFGSSAAGAVAAASTGFAPGAPGFAAGASGAGLPGADLSGPAAPAAAGCGRAGFGSGGFAPAAGDAPGLAAPGGPDNAVTETSPPVIGLAVTALPPLPPRPIVQADSATAATRTRYRIPRPLALPPSESGPRDRRKPGVRPGVVSMASASRGARPQSRPEPLATG